MAALSERILLGERLSGYEKNWGPQSVGRNKNYGWIADLKSGKLSIKMSQFLRALEEVRSTAKISEIPIPLLLI
ncbi:hypothetical protein QUA74_10915 [Microcoleus sp. LAD1_D3]|uniref:hypothetical protein n=1 Tax=Microcoleus sp. LAD1_D3 TaxID=2819365 RepID=UPI002FD68A00